MKKLFLVALPIEIGPEALKKEGFVPVTAEDVFPALYRRGEHDDYVAVIGMGAQQSAASMKQLNEQGFLRDADIVLSGSAGSYSAGFLSIVQCPTGFPSLPPHYGSARIICVHEFVDADHPHPELHAPGIIFDMESEFVAGVIADAAPATFTIIKVISDDGSGSFGDWRTVCEQKVQPLVRQVALRFFNGE